MEAKAVVRSWHALAVRTAVYTRMHCCGVLMVATVAASESQVGGTDAAHMGQSLLMTMRFAKRYGAL